MTLSPFTFTYRGLTFGEGTDLPVTAEIEGLLDVEVRSGSVPLPLGDGSFPGLHRADAVTVIFPILVTGDPSSVALDDRLRAVSAVFAPHPTTEFPLQCRLAHREFIVNCRPVRRKETVGPRTYNRGTVPFTVALERTDPRRYGTTVRNVSVPLFATSGGGFNFPIDFPINMSAQLRDTAVAVNAGDAAAYPLIRVQHVAPSADTFNGFILTNDTAGITTTIDLSASGSSLQPGQILTFNPFGMIHPVGTELLHIEGASRFDAWQAPRVPFYLVPGANQIRLEVLGTATSIAATLTYRDTSL